MAFEKLHYRTMDGDEIVVPYAGHIFRRKEYKNLVKDYKDNPNELDEAMFEKAGFKKDIMDQLDNMLLADYQKFVQVWMGEPGASVGESSAS